MAMTRKPNRPRRAMFNDCMVALQPFRPLTYLTFGNRHVLSYSRERVLQKLNFRSDVGAAVEIVGDWDWCT